VLLIGCFPPSLSFWLSCHQVAQRSLKLRQVMRPGRSSEAVALLFKRSETRLEASHDGSEF
jgi:hypothetical protein